MARAFSRNVKEIEKPKVVKGRKRERDILSARYGLFRGLVFIS